MASPKDKFAKEFFEFDFFQAVRLLEKLAPKRVPIGLDGPPADEVARFRAHLSMSFPPSQIVALDPPGEERPNPLLTVTFLGPVRAVRRPAVALHATADGHPARRPRPGAAVVARLARPVRPPVHLALLPRVGEVPLPLAIRARRGVPRDARHVHVGYPQPDGVGHARPHAPARGAKRAKPPASPGLERHGERTAASTRPDRRPRAPALRRASSPSGRGTRPTSARCSPITSAYPSRCSSSAGSGSQFPKAVRLGSASSGRLGSTRSPASGRGTCSRGSASASGRSRIRSSRTCCPIPRPVRGA